MKHKGPVLNRPRTGQDVRKAGGEDCLKTTMINHYKALIKVKPIVDISKPHPHVGRQAKMSYVDENLIVRNTYKGVATIKQRINDGKPNTFEMKANLQKKYVNSKFEEVEHVRRLNAMSKRITALGKDNERKKNINDPVSNPIYLFSHVGEKKPTKFISLDNYYKKLKALNSEERNKLMFSFADDDKKAVIKRPQSSHPTAHSNNNKSQISRMTESINKNKANITANPEELMRKHIENRRLMSGKPPASTTVKKLRNADDEVNIEFTNESQENGTKRSRSQVKRQTINERTKIGKFIDIPLIKKGDISAFKTDILKYVCANRLYKDKDLEDFRLALFEVNHKAMAVDLLTECWIAVASELEA